MQRKLIFIASLISALLIGGAGFTYAQGHGKNNEHQCKYGEAKGKGGGYGMQHGKGKKNGQCGKHGKGMRHNAKNMQQGLKPTQAANIDNKTLAKGAEVYKTACAACHVSQGQPTIAPPIFAVKNHVIGHYPDRDAFIERVVKWVKTPDSNDALMPGAVRKFGLMPPMPHLNDEDLNAVAAYIYESNMQLPDWYKAHYKEEHGTAPAE